MAKRRNALLSLVAVAALLFTGCSGDSGNASSEYPDSSITASTSAVTSESTVETSLPPETPEQSDQRIEEIFSGKLDEQGKLRYYSFEEGNTSFLNSATDNAILSTFYAETGAVVQLTDLTNGKTAQTELRYSDIESSEMPWSIYLISGFPVIYNLDSGTISVYDRDIKLLNELKTDFVSALCHQSSENSLALADYLSNRIVITDISGTGEISAREYSLPDDIQFSVTYVHGEVLPGEFLLSCMDNDTYGSFYGIFDTESGQFTRLSLSDNDIVNFVSGNLVIESYNSPSLRIFSPYYPDMTKTLNAPTGASRIYPSLVSRFLYFYSCVPAEDGGSELKLYRYDIESCRLDSMLETKLSSQSFYIYGVYESSRSVYFTANDNDSDIIVLWQPEPAAEQLGYNAIAGTDYSTLNSALAEKISDCYSIDVHYGSDGVRYFNDYAVVSETDEMLINTALSKLDSFFGRFPEGFFSELVQDAATYKGIDIYLTGTIVPNLYESLSISDAAAFVSIDGEKQIMVIDITQTWGFEKTTAHEFMHIIENAIYDKRWDGVEWKDLESFARWEMLNPPDFSYYYQYTDENGATLGYDAKEYNGALYFDGCGIDVNSIYFVDGYSMTFPTEDRARIFENIAVCTPEILPDYFKSRPMQLKAAYLCACIREAFDCITDDTVLFWEKSIDPEYTLEYFKQNYDLENYYSGSAVG